MMVTMLKEAVIVTRASVETIVLNVLTTKSLVSTAHKVWL